MTITFTIPVLEVWQWALIAVAAWYLAMGIVIRFWLWDQLELGDDWRQPGGPPPQVFTGFMFLVSPVFSPAVVCFLLGYLALLFIRPGKK